MIAPDLREQDAQLGVGPRLADDHEFETPALFAQDAAGVFLGADGQHIPIRLV